MKQKTLLHFWLLLCLLVTGGGSSAWAQSDLSSTYTSNVTLSATNGTKATASTIVINSSNYSAMKLGSNGNAGSFKATFPIGTKYIHLHAAGWNGKSNTLNLSTINNNSYSSPTLPISLTANSGISGNSSTYTFGTGNSDSNPNSANHYKVITLSSALTTATEITISCSERCVIWGVNSEAASSTYTVTYDSNGATSGDVPEDDNEYDKDATVTVLGNTGSLAKTGYAFGGWNTEADGTGTNYSAGGTFSITANTTLYAKWNPYTITAVSNNNSYGTVSGTTTITATPAEGYRVVAGDGGYTVTSGTATVVNNGDNTFTVTPSSDCTVQINFEAIPTHTVTISTPTGGTLTVKNGDDVVSSGSSIREGTTLTIVPEEDSSHEFAKWTATVGNTSTDYTDVFTYTVPASDFTLSATFNEVVKYAVNWSVNGNVTTEYYQKDEDIVFPDDPDNIEGKEFMGWCASTVSTTDTKPTLVSEATMETSDLNYYAVFAQKNTSIIIDTLTRATTGITNGTTTYSGWSGKSARSSAVYAGNSAGGNDAIQLRASNNSGVVSTTSGGIIKKVAVKWNTNTTSGRTIDIYGKHTAYSSASNLFGTVAQMGKKLGSIVYGTSTELTITVDSTYIGIRSNSGALYIDSLFINWEATSYSAYETTVPLKYALTFSNPTGGTIGVVDGNDETVSSGDRFYAETDLVITATPSTGYSFSGWSATAGTIDDDTEAETIFTTAESAAILSATFTKNSYTLSTSATNGTLAVTVDGDDWDGESKIEYGSTVSITPTPADDYAFATWSSSDIDGLNTTATPLEFTMPAKDVSVTGNFVAADIDYNIAVADDLPDGVSVSVADDATTAKAGDKIVVSYTESDDYDFDSWNVVDDDDNTVTVTYDEGKDEYSFTMPAKDVTVGATYQRMYKITYKVTGEEDVVSRVASGSTLDISEPASGPDFTFAGWSESNTISSTPTFATATAVTGNKTLYAIYYAKQSETSYRLVEANQANWLGDYLIAYDDDTFADGRKGGTDSNCIGASGVMANTTGRVMSKDKKTIDATWGDTYHVSLVASATSGYYLLQTQDGKYNYQSSNANGLTATETKETADSYKLTITFTSSSDVKLKLSGSANGAVFRYNTGGFFRYYKDGGQSAVYLYKKVTTPAVYTLGETVSVSVSAAGYATYCSNKALDFSHADDGLTAYIVTSDGETTDYTKMEETVPANTGLLLKAAQGSYNVLVVGASSTNVSDNKLVGVLTDTGISATADGKTNFVLRSTVQYGVGFYKVTAHNDGNPDFTVRANSAYLSVALADASRSFFEMPEDETTGLNEVRSKMSEVREGIYDMQGRKVAQPTKGLYIVNGKKVVIK
ncbi:MAG: InlB B-repeat-containing protein [Prevotella sp.]|nr:InlB B-repeat-containing protein [Prevotella sp.]